MPRKQFIDIETARTLYAQGKSIREVAAALGVKSDVVRYRLREHGIARRAPGYHRPATYQPSKHRAKTVPSYRFQHRAHRMVEAALKAGQIQKPERCERCGQDLALHAHHADYGQPLSVEWLCTSCHRRWHQKNKAVYPLERVAWQVHSIRGSSRV